MRPYPWTEQSSNVLLNTLSPRRHMIFHATQKQQCTYWSFHVVTEYNHTKPILNLISCELTTKKINFLLRFLMPSHILPQSFILQYWGSFIFIYTPHRVFLNTKKIWTKTNFGSVRVSVIYYYWTRNFVFNAPKWIKFTPKQH